MCLVFLLVICSICLPLAAANAFGHIELDWSTVTDRTVFKKNLPPNEAKYEFGLKKWKTRRCCLTRITDVSIQKCFTFCCLVTLATLATIATIATWNWLNSYFHFSCLGDHGENLNLNCVIAIAWMICAKLISELFIFAFLGKLNMVKIVSHLIIFTLKKYIIKSSKFFLHINIFKWKINCKWPYMLWQLCKIDR